MPNRLIFRAAPAAVLMTFAAGPAAAQAGLYITVSPNPNKIEAGVSALTFSVPVNPVQCAGKCSFRVEGQANTSAFTTEWLSEANDVTLTFAKSYTVPASAGVGDKLCFSLRLNQTLLNRFSNSKVVATECRTVSTPLVTASTQPAPTAVAAPPTGTSRASATDPPRTAVRRVPLPPPDLTIAYEKAPVAKWIVRNIGQGPAPATVLRLSRDGLPNTNITIAALVAGATFEVVVTPELDAYLVNASATVDPDNQVQESNEANNTWQSSQSR